MCEPESIRIALAPPNKLLIMAYKAGSHIFGAHFGLMWVRNVSKKVIRMRLGSL